MKRMTEKVRNWLGTRLDLPTDVALDLPRITMVGQLHIYIENHRGLLVFTEEETRLLLKKGQLLIKGKDFVIKSIIADELLLEGKIEKVIYIDE